MATSPQQKRRRNRFLNRGSRQDDRRDAALDYDPHTHPAFRIVPKGPLVGTQPTPATPFFVQAGSHVDADTDVDHADTITYPVPFPNGVLSVQVTHGDGTVPGTAIWTSVHTLTGFLVARDGGNAAWRINWVAIGW